MYTYTEVPTGTTAVVVATTTTVRPTDRVLLVVGIAIGLRSFIQLLVYERLRISLLSCLFDTKVCVHVMRWKLRTWWLLICLLVRLIVFSDVPTMFE